jgi:hypothetical protein
MDDLKNESKKEDGEGTRLPDKKRAKKGHTGDKGIPAHR